MADTKSKKAPERAATPSELEGLQRQHNLTRDEADRVYYGESPDTVKGERVVYRQRYDKLPVSAAEHPLAQADENQKQQEEEAKKAGDKPEHKVDPTQPEAGPWGPDADYHETKE